MTKTTLSPSAWWKAQRLRYNVGLLAAGGTAFTAYLIIGSMMLRPDEGFEITLFTTLAQGITFLMLVGIANLLYFLGPLSEQIVRPSNPEVYRQICFRLGYWGSMLLPFTVPILLAASTL